MILFQDEASLSNTATVSYAWSGKGKQPKIKQKQKKRERRTLFGCVDPKSGIVVNSVENAENMKTFFKFIVKTCKIFFDKKSLWL